MRRLMAGMIVLAKASSNITNQPAARDEFVE
jgi:hypothetical protein